MANKKITIKHNKMEDLEFVKRLSGYRKLDKNKPTLRVETIKGRFTVNNKLAELLKVDHADGIMFGFNQKEKTAYVVKDNESDAFIIKRKDSSCLRFTSKDLMGFFYRTFSLTDKDKTLFVFKVDETPNDRGLYRVYLS